jgi:hypothetical protein
MRGLLGVKVLGMGVGLLSLCVMFDRKLEDDLDFCWISNQHG